MHANNLRPISDDEPARSDAFRAGVAAPSGETDSRPGDQHKDPRLFSKGELLFIEGTPARGVFHLREGSVKLSTTTAAGRSVILGIAGPGDMLGLAAVIRTSEYEATAEALDACAAEFVPRADLLRRLSEDIAIVRGAAEQLSRDCLAAHKAISSLISTEPVLIRLARQFLSWAPDDGCAGPVRITNVFTHQQLAEMVGTTRETVTRALRELRERDLATLKGRDLVIHNPDRLRLLSGGRAKLGNTVL